MPVPGSDAFGGRARVYQRTLQRLPLRRLPAAGKKKLQAGKVQTATAANILIIWKAISVMTYEKQIARSVTRIYKAVFPNTVNHYDTMFGGTAMQLMDEVAFITATRFCRMRVVTVSSDRIDFKKPIPHGTIIELIGEVTHVGTTSLKVRVTVYVEQMYSNHREKAIEGTFAFVAIDDQKRPTAIVLPPDED